MRRSVSAGLVGVAVLVAACERPAPVRAPIPPVSTGKVRVRVFTEPSPVKSVTTVGRFVFVATDRHVERWDGEGSVIPLSAEQGLRGTQIVATAPDPDRRYVWILTEGGVGYYDASAEVYRAVAAPPATAAIDFGALAREGATLAPSSEGGVWLGTARGLVHVSAAGSWIPTPIKEPIRALARDHAGWLWVATPGGLLARKPVGDIVRVGASHGCGIAAPRLLVELPGDQLLVIGTDDAGGERVAIGKELAWTTYRALPDVHWDAAARRGDGARNRVAQAGLQLLPRQVDDLSTGKLIELAALNRVDDFCRLARRRNVVEPAARRNPAHVELENAISERV